jgi:(R,R)-butanediol dehydrogenase/meso-butanediol dehydrogenase/diacetyl reductase
MKAVVWYAKKDVRVEEIDEPKPGPGQVKIKVKWCGICGSDLHEYLDGPFSIPVDKPHPLSGKKAPVVMGHEFSGDIVEVGEGVTDWKVGDKVTAEATVACLECHFCKLGQYSYCEKLGIFGVCGSGGAMADYVLADAPFVHKIPDKLDYEKASLVEPIAIGFHSVVVGNFRAGMTAVVLGAGPIGLGVIESLRASAKMIIAVVRKSIRQEYALRSGADVLLDPYEVDAPAEIKKLTGGLGADFCFETFGVDFGVELGLNCLHNGGTLVEISLWNKPVPVDLMQVVMGEKHIIGSNLYSYNDFETVLKMLEDGRIPADNYITKRIA